jgi:phosphoglycerate kinase
MAVINGIRDIDEGEFSSKSVLLRVDINSPIDGATGLIVNDNRIQKSVTTIQDLSDKGAKLVIIAHQGDTTDYRSLISLKEHAGRLAEAVGKPIDFIEDIAGPAAVEKIQSLQDGEILLLDNIRYLVEEASTFEDVVKQEPADMVNCYMIRRLAPLFDAYVNDAFAAAHRNSPSMVGFQEVLPSYAGRLLMNELAALQAITSDPARPCIYILGGARAGDAFGMIEQVLKDGSADKILMTGLVGQIFMIADGVDIGKSSAGFVSYKGFDQYIAPAKEFLDNYPGIIAYASDVAVKVGNARANVALADITDDMDLADIGDQTIADYCEVIGKAKTIFVNGPCGIYEDEMFEKGTKTLWNAVADAEGYSVIGGGDSVTSFVKYTDISKVDYVSTAGGALIRYLSGIELPLLKAISKSA